jgi:protein-disulfide isomerase
MTIATSTRLALMLLLLAGSGAALPAFGAEAAPIVPSPPRSPWLSDGLLARLEASQWISLSDASSDRTVYVLIDTECPYCHTLMTRLAQSAPDVQVRYVLVAVLEEASLPRAAAILDSKDRRAALARLLDGGQISRSGGSGASRSTVERNNGFLRALGLVATPGLVYRGDDGAIRALAGIPSDDEVRQIFRLDVTN